MPDKKSSSLTNIIQRFAPALTGFVRSRVNRSEDAEDVLQEVWYQLSRLSNIDELENTGAWLYRVARNKITDLYRKKRNDSSLEDYASDQDEQYIRDILLMDDSESPELASFKEVFWKELTLALKALPENQQRVFILNEVEDMTLQEIADLENENIKTIISRKGYAVKHLRKRLEHLFKELNL
jgi:RNA polymerase sigma factor (sigma-70 family)